MQEKAKKNAPKDVFSWRFLGVYNFLLASYVSMVFVWMTTEVSPFCHASERVVTVRVTLQDVSPSPAANAVRAVIIIMRFIIRNS